MLLGTFIARILTKATQRLKPQRHEPGPGAHSRPMSLPKYVDVGNAVIVAVELRE
jgi:hypothetical protein